jgi:hypothetical protein
MYMPESFSETEAYNRQLFSIVQSNEEYEASKTIREFSSLDSRVDNLDETENAGVVDLLAETSTEQLLYDS